MIWLILWGCAGAPAPGELWLMVEATDEDGRVRLTVPATTLRTADQPRILQTADGPVDITAVAKRLAVGAERTWTLEEGSATLRHTAPTPGAATQLRVSIDGGNKKGNGIEIGLSFPLEPKAIAEAQRSHLDVRMDSLPVHFDEDACAQLRRSPPTAILEVVGPKNRGLHVVTVAEAAIFGLPNP